ncbi:TatD family hydrolase [Kineosporia succinea]|uniref:TatD DNase family protein n=1 Tax=Kineosporia succinea TaxID=84632 RepID=A0ABT9NYV7_9ACTN|nr:TatD family hydrolase [Kineosporia succinea]MDP9825623.1 TatD DNase family protein [Kineosporia succinea]
MKKNDEPVPLPEALPSPVVDNHTHLDHVRGTEVGSTQAEQHVKDLIGKAVSVNVTRMVQIGCDLPAARWTVEAVDRFPELLGGVALHPTEATKHAASKELNAAFAEIEQLARHPRVRVIGETGLDHYWVTDDDGKAAQEDSFRRHIDLAKRLGKALQIHDRDAHDDVIRVLDEEGTPEKTVFHCFSGDAAMARLAADRGWYLSFAGTVTFKNAADLREALKAVPLERVMVETDAPYLTPVPHRGRVNASYLVPLTVRAMAAELGRDLDEVCTILNSTTESVYGPW